jgi:hypothetical protein
MKVFNLTDVPTKALVQRKLINQTIVVGRTAISPGSSAELKGEAHEHSSLKHPLSVGAAAMDDLPQVYIDGKAKPAPKPAPPPPPAPVVTDAPPPVSRRGKGL